MRVQKYTALRIAITYAIISAVWILLSDSLLDIFFTVEQHFTLSVVKGYLFILVTASLLYFLVRNSVNRILNTEAQLRVIFDSVDDGIQIFGVNPDGSPGNFLDINEAVMDRLGYTRQELLSMNPLQLVKNEMRPATRQALLTMKETGSAVIETIHVTKSGREIPVEISARFIAVDDLMIGASIVRDITVRKREEEMRREVQMAAERDKRRFYKETVLAVTGGKFELGEIEDAPGWIGSPQLAMDISGMEMLSQARRRAVKFCLDSGLPADEAGEFEFAIGEAVGNALKHANGGEMYVGVDALHVWVAVVDHGTGIDTFSLPKVALLPGFTTKASMGLGYTMILQVCDHVKLATGPTGTTVYMQKNLVHVEDIDKRLNVHSGIQWPSGIEL